MWTPVYLVDPPVVKFLRLVVHFLESLLSVDSLRRRGRVHGRTGGKERRVTESKEIDRKEEHWNEKVEGLIVEKRVAYWSETGSRLKRRGL